MKELWRELYDMLSIGMLNHDVAYGTSCHFCEGIKKLGGDLHHTSDCKGIKMLARIYDLIKEES